MLDRLRTSKFLTVGLVNGRNVWRYELEQALAQLQPAQERFGDNLWVSTSCSLLHSPVDLEREDRLDPELKSWLAFAVQKCGEVAVLRDALNDPQAPGVQHALADSRDVHARRAARSDEHKAEEIGRAHV